MQNQSFELGAEALKAGGFKFIYIYRSLMALTTERDSGLVFWRPPAGRCTVEGAFHPNCCWVRGYRMLAMGLYFLQNMRFSLKCAAWLPFDQVKIKLSGQSSAVWQLVQEP